MRRTCIYAYDGQRHSCVRSAVHASVHPCVRTRSFICVSKSFIKSGNRQAAYKSVAKGRTRYA